MGDLISINVCHLAGLVMQGKIDMKKQITKMSYIWLALILMSILAFGLSKLDLITLGINKSYLITAVMLLTITKAKLITGFFMELNSASTLWRRSFNTYIVIVPVVTALAYGFA